MKHLLYILALLGTLTTAQGQFTCTMGSCISGYGVCVFPSGAQYKGDFKDGKIHGLGILYFPNGDTYIGNWRNQKRQGKGRFRFATGDEYLGEFVQNKMQGYGTMTYLNGNRYEGEWLANKPHGEGTFELANGNKYVGYFVDGKFEGQGTMYYGDGSYYQGEWKENLRHGEGTLVAENGVRQSGWWESDMLIEPGPVLTREEQQHAQQRDAEYDERNQLRNCNQRYCAEGRGEFLYDNGIYYVGTFRDGHPEGSGIVTYPNGDRYEGGWYNHAPNGRGTMYYRNGQVLHAQWENARPTEILLAGEEQPSEQREQPTADSDDEVKVWAVIIGASQYRHMQTLKYTDDDAYHLFAFMKSPYGGAVPDEQIRLLVDEDATRNNILDAVEHTFGQADANDVILFYFSGHGIDGAFLPIDYDGYNNRLMHEEIRDLVDRSSARHKLVIADACHSGSIFLRRTPAHRILEKYYEAFENSNGGLALLMSSKGEEFSLEDNSLRSGVFSYYLIRAMKGAADRDYNGVVTVQEAYEYTRRNVQSYTGYVQTPLLLGQFDEMMPVSVVH